MIKNIKNSFVILKNNKGLLFPLVLFLFILNFLGIKLMGLEQKILLYLILFINIILLLCAFASGWLTLIKNIVEKYVKNEEDNSLKFKSLFFSGVGNYFFSALGTVILYIIIFIVYTILCYKLGVNLIGNEKLLMDTLQQYTLATEEQIAYFEKLSYTENIVLLKWMGLLTFATIIWHISFMFLPAIIFLETKNPIKVIFKSIILFFKKPKTVIFTTIFLLILSIINLFFNFLFAFPNFIISTIGLFLMLILMTYHVIFIFLTYETKIKNNSNCGCNCYGEEQSCN